MLDSREQLVYGFPILFHEYAVGKRTWLVAEEWLELKGSAKNFNSVFAEEGRGAQEAVQRPSPCIEASCPGPLTW